MTSTDSSHTLHYLDSILKHGSYTKAAKDLYVSQPYLTQLIKRIEQEIGTEILNRQTSPIQLTEAGKLYYEYLMSLELAQEQFHQKISRYSTQDTRTIKIGILSSLGTYLLPLFLPGFLEKHPSIRIEIREDFSETNEMRAMNGELDFFIGQNPETLSPSLDVVSWGPHGYYAVIADGSSFYAAHSETPEDIGLDIKTLLQQPLVLTKKGSSIRRQLDHLFQKFKIKPNIVLESHNIYTILELAKKGAGVAFVPYSICPPETPQGYRLLPLPLDLLSIDYFIAHAKNKTLSPVEKDLVALFAITCVQDMDANRS
ncbi:LysR family transcriptional regulator [Saccharibacillus sp. CPCC 101409]|uniref:LysR family transcriptional regulator n=1 Tax=Saccharibacillus sp. CPCC 101409 TaxID=3058041 RepID=UPI0026721058|nr:LysR family transcriptional regulator [Saccharibacillus sp. CPCC 101409]MDO3411500.1 LysR family transcriptional regulator [Saccharibacillus sp. CPCC 101409]